MPKRVNKYKNLPESERILIDKFVQTKRTQKGEPLSESRKKKYRTDLGVILSELGKPSKEVTKNDLENYLAKKRRYDLSDWTKYDIRVECKCFFGWLAQREEIHKVDKAWFCNNNDFAGKDADRD